jgi:hypothetical protein
VPSSDLAGKLGLRPGEPVRLLHPPAGFDPGRPVIATPARITVLFCADSSVLAADLPAAAGAVDRDGALWVCWPKRASKVPTDLSDGVVRDAGLATGLVDVKVAAIDPTWSGLKFVQRRQLSPAT